MAGRSSDTVLRRRVNLVHPAGARAGGLSMTVEGNAARPRFRHDVSSPEVARPAAVRHGWADNPPVNLDNKAGLHASPFRTVAPTMGDWITYFAGGFRRYSIEADLISMPPSSCDLNGLPSMVICVRIP
jgi:hypothetical protein